MHDSLFRLWEATVGRAPAAVALDDAAGGRRWTRAALAEAAGRRAQMFARQAGEAALRGSRVVFAVPNGAEWFQVFLGLLGAGAVPAPVDPSEPEAAQVAAAASIGASFILRGGRLRRVRGARRAGGGACLVKLTSGSSGGPKGLAVTDAQMEADGRQICSSMGIGPEDANLAAIPLGYSYGLGNLVMPLVLQGTRVVCLSSPLPHAIAADAMRFSPTVFPAVPPLLRGLASSDLPRGSLSSLRLVISAGSPLPADVARCFAEKFGLRVHGFYGTSETGGIAYDRTGDATLEGRSVGTPMEKVRIAFGKAGRFTVLSPAVAGRGRHSPADRARLNGQGEVVLLGRTGRAVKVAGRRVDLAEVERALRSLPGVRDCLAHAEGGLDGRLSAAVATELPAAEIRRLLRPRIAAWKIPQRIATFREFPVTARGKTDTRRLCQALCAPRTATSISTLSAERQMPAPR